MNSSGKATLVPIAILINGKFYDAGAYKADPVPMALDSGTVYEAESSGDSLGLFTLNGALHSKAPSSPNPWVATGSYLAERKRRTQAGPQSRKRAPWAGERRGPAAADQSRRTENCAQREFNGQCARRDRNVREAGECAPSSTETPAPARGRFVRKSARTAEYSGKSCETG